MEVPWNLYTTNLYIYEVPRMTNGFLYPNNSKTDEKEPRYNETSSKRTNFASALALRYVEGPLY